jgi:hypothetical protein
MLARLAAAALAGLLFASCATPIDSAGDPATAIAAPTYRVGDQWVYRVRDGFANPQVFEETFTVTTVAANSASVRVTFDGPGGRFERTEHWIAPGKLVQGALFDVETRRFGEPLERFRFPLQAGASWSQFVRNYNELAQREGVINYYARVGGRESITTPAGTFDAVRLRVVMRLDDEETWRYGTDCNYTVWYAPAVKGVVREVRRADYMEKSGG